MRKHNLSLWTLLLAGLLVSGCALTQYGRLQGLKETDDITVHVLRENWEAYDIYYAGLNVGHPSALLFGRRDDDRRLIAERWVKVTSREQLNNLINSIERQLPIGNFYPRLWKTVGPDGHLYGYMFTSWDHAVMKAVDGKTLQVNDLPKPPYLAFTGGTGSDGGSE